MDKEARSMTVKMLADFLNDSIKYGGGDDPVYINGKPIRAIRLSPIKEGQPSYIDLLDTPEDTSKMKRFVPGGRYKITKVEASTEKQEEKGTEKG